MAIQNATELILPSCDARHGLALDPMTQTAAAASTCSHRRDHAQTHLRSWRDIARRRDRLSGV